MSGEWTGQGIGNSSTLASTVAANLDGLIWLFPNLGNRDATSSDCPFATSAVAQMGGDISILYQVTLRFRGVVEVRAYTGGTQTTRITQGGMKDPTNPGGMSPIRNVYRLEIEDPSDYYWLNSYQAGTDATTTRTYAFDQSITIPIRGQALVRLIAYADYEWVTDVPSAAYVAGQARNQDGSGANPQSVGGSLLVTEPYDGQFIQMNVTSVT